ncbi:trypco2 family protein [Streptomyces sp. NPDC029216]|uniref:trypco2 family protein n=1 Tax=Streptomyces sp. NPDC029216 TaxID=3154701 RepID=UPI0033F0EBD0
MQPSLDSIELSAAVQGIRDQLVAAAAESAGREILFEVDGITLDFAVELRRDVGAKLGFKAWVLTGDAHASAAKSVTHKVSITLRPKTAADGASVAIGSESPVDLQDFTVVPSNER